MIRREVFESPMVQGVDEVIIYTLDTTPWGGGPSSPSVVVYALVGGVKQDDVTEDVMPINSPSVDGDIITLSALSGLEADTRYRIEVRWTKAGATFEAYAIINAEE